MKYANVNKSLTGLRVHQGWEYLAGIEFIWWHIYSTASLWFGSFVSSGCSNGGNRGWSHICCYILPVNDAAAEGPSGLRTLFLSFCAPQFGREEVHHSVDESGETQKMSSQVLLICRWGFWVVFNQARILATKTTVECVLPWKWTLSLAFLWLFSHIGDH